MRPCRLASFRRRYSGFVLLPIRMAPSSAMAAPLRSHPHRQSTAPTPDQGTEGATSERSVLCVWMSTGARLAGSSVRARLDSRSAGPNYDRPVRKEIPMEELLARITQATGLDAATAQRAIGIILAFL